MVSLTPNQRKQAEKILVILENMSVRSSQMIELVDRMIDHRAKAHNDKLLWLMERGESIPEHVKLSM